VTFAADCIAAMTGVDPAAGVRGRWRDARGAITIMRGFLGEGSLLRLAEAVLGRAAAPRLARRGDIVSVGDGRVSLAVVLGQRAAAPGPDGLTMIAMARWTACFPVGWDLTCPPSSHP